MVKRITEKPFPIRVAVVESAANTYTEVDITLPIAPVLGRGELQAVELMTVTSEMTTPTPEAGQLNSTSLQLVRDSQTALLTFASDQLLWKRRPEVNTVEVTAVGEIFTFGDQVQYQDLTDHDGNGRIVAEQTIHLGIQGIGNPGAANAQIMVLAHLVELDSDDAIVLLLEAD